MSLEIRQNGKTLEFLEPAEGGTAPSFSPSSPAAPFQLSPSGQDNVDISIEVRGLYPIREIRYAK